ncbi:MAG: cupredoxin family copper-binding protein [Caldilineaceae bacterium]|nr:cupredoxin family copper-binding protein [Caldilineaceae bacterium]
MKHKAKRLTTLLTLALAALVVLAGCQMAPQEPAVITVVVTATPEAMEPMATAEPEATAMEAEMEAEMEPEMEMEKTSIADLRVSLDQLLGEHVLLAASATNAALHGRTADFEAAAGSLDNNSQDLAATIGSVYGEPAGDAFLALWRTHIGFFVDYTVAVASDDAAAKEGALTALDGYADDFAAFLSSANPEIDPAVVAANLRMHVATLTAAIDAQALDDFPSAFANLREAYAHMDSTASYLATAIGAQFPDLFEGSADTPAAGLQSALNTLLAEHVYVASLATGAALGGRDAEFEAAAGSLDNNTQDLAAAVGSVYGEGAGDAFLALWRTHIGFFVDYTVAVATDDAAQKEQALADLTGYATDFGAFLNSANPDLPVETVAELLVPHVATLTAAIDAQAAGDPVMAYSHLREAYAHMRMIADPLAGSIIAQFPDIFGMDEMGMEGMDHSEMDASQIVMSASQLRSTLGGLLGEHVLITASATDAALRGRTADFEAAAQALDTNSVDIAAAIGLVYGEDAEEAFLALWRTHIGFFVDYTVGVATGDRAMSDKALADLDGYADDFGAFLSSANPNLPAEAVASLLRSHVTTLVAMIDAQAVETPQESGDQQTAYTALRAAYAHMDMTATGLASAISTQFPARFPGEAGANAANLRAALNALLGEHTYLLAKTAVAAIDSRTIEFEAAAGTLDLNSQDLAAAVGSVYGEGAGDAFLALWRKHIGFFTDYMLAVGADDAKGKEKATAELVGYATDFAAFLNSANPDLPVDVVEGLVVTHAQTVLAVIDAAGENDPTTLYADVRAAYAHMSMIANPLAGAIIAQFPDIFGMEMPAEMMMEMESEAGAMAEEKPMETVPATESETMAEGVAEAMTVEIDIQTFAFDQQTIEIPVGTTVVWTNRDAANHTVTSGMPGTPDGKFDSGNFNQNETFSFTFTEAGSYDYFCQRHNHMRGLIVVK